MATEFHLTPAQVSFVKSLMPGFSPDTAVVELAGQAGSARYFMRVRVATGQSAVLVVWDSRDEDWPRFLAVPEELKTSVSFLPEIYGSDARHGLILEEDLGDVTLRYYCRDHTAAEMEAMYRRTLDALCAWQNLGPGKSPTVSSRKMDIETFLWETEYFARRCVADFCGCEHVLGAAWEKERLLLAEAAVSLPQTFIHRDFQSENVMIANDTIRFVDFQGARLGPPAYDVASLLFDPYAGELGPELVERLFAYYAGLPLKVQPDGRAFLLCAAQRLMQALGAYGNLSIHKGKTRYREFVPVAMARLCAVLKKLPEYGAIGRVAGECAGAVSGDRT